MDFPMEKKKKEKVLIDLEDSNSDEPKEIASNKVLKSEPAALPPLPVTKLPTMIIRDEQEEARIAEEERAFIERMNKKIAERKLMENLRKQFQYFFFLSRETLLKIRDQMSLYICKCEKQSSTGRKSDPLRFQNRQKLLRISLLCRAQMEFKKTAPANQVEKYLLKAGADYFKYILTYVESLEEHLFVRLYDSFAIHRGKYPSQLKNLIMHLEDDVNFNFRRNFLNKTMSVDYISDTPVEEMTTPEEKERNLAKMRKIINQSTDVAKYLKATYQKQEEEAEKKRLDPNYVPYKPPEENEDHKRERLKELRIYYERVAAAKDKLKASRRNMRIRIEKIEGNKGKKMMKDFRETLPMID